MDWFVPNRQKRFTRWQTQGRLSAAIFALASLLSGCANTTEVDNTLRDAAVYRSVIVDVVDSSGVELDDTEDLPMVFVEAFDADGIALEVQVEIVNGLIETYHVRFIDHIEEAIEIDFVDMPVRENSLLIGLGPIVRDETIDVRAELYLSSDVVRAYRYTLAGSNDRWAIVGPPEEIEPEGFVSAT